jgi:hypothetical protein
LGSSGCLGFVGSGGFGVSVDEGGALDSDVGSGCFAVVGDAGRDEGAFDSCDLEEDVEPAGEDDGVAVCDFVEEVVGFVEEMVADVERKVEDTEDLVMQ